MRVSLWLILLILPAVPGRADGITITGRVVDENGSPVAGTRVSAIAGPGATPQTANTSDVAGLFHFEIPVEGQYELRAQHEGFFPFQIQSIDLRVGTPLEIRMNHLNELTESVQVRYSPPMIDPEETSHVKRLDSKDMLNVPTANSQDFRSSLPLMPGVVRDSSGRAHFNGGRAGETNYRLNGFNVSDPGTGDLTARLNVDAIETMEWEASRVPADAGKGSGGTLNLRTQMGDDHWRFGSTNLVPGLGTEGGAHLNHWSPRVQFSGPIRKGRGWFHNAFDVYYVSDTVSHLPPGLNRANSLSGNNLTRLQWNVRENQILTGSFLINLEDSHRVGLSFLNPVESTVDRRRSLLLGTIKDQFLTRGGLLEIGFANTSGYLRASPQGTQPYSITPFGASGNFFRDETQRSERQEWLLNGFLRSHRWHGTHQLATGADVERSALDQLIVRQDLTVVRTDGSVVRDVHFVGSPKQTVENVEVYGYATDRWNPTSSLTLDLGLRTQWDRYSGGAPPAPRLAAAWAPKRLRGATKLTAGWGVYYDPLSLRMVALSQEQSSISTFYSANGLPMGAPVESRYVLDPHDLRLAKFTITSFTLEQQITPSIFGKVSLLSREGSRGPTFVEDLSNYPRNDYVHLNIERQVYRSAEFSAKGTFFAKYQWFASYTRSVARTNTVLAYSIENPLLAPQMAGPLDWDAPNRFLMWGWVPVGKRWLPHLLQRLVGDTDFQLLTDYRTGFPFTVTTEDGHIVGMPNQARFPDYLSVNIALERKFPFRGYLWAFRAGLVNALDRQNANVVNSDFNSPQFMTFAQGQPRAVNVRLRFVGRK